MWSIKHFMIVIKTALIHWMTLVIWVNHLGQVHGGQHLLQLIRFVYICSSLLQLIVESHGLSQAEKKIFVLQGWKFTKLLRSCLVLLQVPKYFELVHIFWASPKIWLHLVHFQKLFCWHKNQFYWIQIIFLPGTKCLQIFGLAQKIWTSPKSFGICNFLCQTKNLFTYCGSHKHFVPDKKLICIQ